MVVTANYKMSYDLLRSSLIGKNVWLLILETFGINVWCAAGKGSFGTDELIRQIERADLKNVVDHHTLLLPILGAPGVAAHEVARQTEFKVRYATIRVDDLPEYLENGMQTTPAMQELTFSLRERLVLTPIEFVLSLKFALPVALLLLLIGWWFGGIGTGLTGAGAILGAVVTGTIVVPVLLPWLPGSSFAFKGILAGLLWSIFWIQWAGEGLALPITIGSILALTTVSSFCAFNFTGSTPFTSPSGVRKEMRIALPIMATALLVSALLVTWGFLTS